MVELERASQSPHSKWGARDRAFRPHHAPAATGAGSTSMDLPDLADGAVLDHLAECAGCRSWEGGGNLRCHAGLRAASMTVRALVDRSGQRLDAQHVLNPADRLHRDHGVRMVRCGH